MGFTGGDQRLRRGEKLQRGRGNPVMAQSPVPITAGCLLEHRIDHCGVRADLLHRSAVDREMGQVHGPAKGVGEQIALLLRHKAVDQTGHLRMGWRHPWHPARSQMLLQGLQQLHEIPHCENVVFHEQPQASNRVDRQWQRVTLQLHQLTAQALSGQGNHRAWDHPPR